MDTSKLAKDAGFIADSIARLQSDVLLATIGTTPGSADSEHLSDANHALTTMTFGVRGLARSISGVGNRPHAMSDEGLPPGA